MSLAATLPQLPLPTTVTLDLTGGISSTTPPPAAAAAAVILLLLLLLSSRNGATKKKKKKREKWRRKRMEERENRVAMERIKMGIERRRQTRSREYQCVSC